MTLRRLIEEAFPLKKVSDTRWRTGNGLAPDSFRREIREAFGGRASRALAPFAAFAGGDAAGQSVD